ncbi:hypothetical protein EG329_010881 [Mollisiaceae sp. DMI_Dod_QoI]|nr:hypothetical protein EG329_010881 [Helotiales sp. DMI_Dod_QoI]
MDLLATTQQPSELCSRCAQIDLNSRWDFWHHDFMQLKLYATTLHCPMCKLFSEPFRSTTIISNPCSIITIIPRSGQLGYKFHNQREHLYEIVASTESNVAATNSEQRDTSQITTDFRMASAHPLADQNILMINLWLSSCSVGHDRCKQTPGFTSPTRLLDIRGPQLRLISPRENNLRYTILSHCWGGNIPLVTTASTIELFHRRIDWSAAPATFKDAITTSRKLDIRYLWIDSLCIIQDSKIDWETECQNMGDYYKHAYLTLSVLDSPGSDTGFLHPRKPSAVRLSDSNMWIRPAGRVPKIIFQESYLNKRGWALQERLLSTRILHFSRDEILWECQTCSATETSSREHYDPVDVSSLVSSEGQDFKRATLQFGPDPYSLSDGAFAAWYRIAKHFSRRSLTYESDRLPAISGIARLIGQRTGFAYIAGLWEEDPHGIVWCIESPKDRVSHQSRTRDHARPVDISYPSWSWAKMKHSVSWPFYDQGRTDSSGDARILQSKIASESGDPYRAIQTAELELEATTLDVQCIPAHWVASLHIRNFHTRPSYRHDKKEIVNLAPALREGLNLNIYHDGVMIGSGCYDDPEIAEIVEDCTAVCVATRMCEKSTIKINHFLLVRRFSKENGTWERVGVGMTRAACYSGGFTYFKEVFEGRPKEILRLR